MPESILAVLPDLWTAFLQTALMLGIGLTSALIIGGPLGIVLFLVADGQALQNRTLALVLGWIVNTVRSFPFIILMVALVPVTRSTASSRQPNKVVICALMRPCPMASSRCRW